MRNEIEVLTILAKRRVECSEGCPGWGVFLSPRGLEIEVCDECNHYHSLWEDERLLDEEVAQLPDARSALAEALAALPEEPAPRQPRARSATATPTATPDLEQLVAWCDRFDARPTEGWLLAILAGEIEIDDFCRAVLAGTAPRGV